MSALNQIDIVADCVISARALLHESLVSLLQAAEPRTHGLSAATKTAMGKRGLAQLEAVKGLIDQAAELAHDVRTESGALQAKTAAAIKARDEALAAAAVAEQAGGEARARSEAEVASETEALREATSRSEAAAAAAGTRAAAAEAAAAAASAGLAEAERQRGDAEAALAAAAEEGAAQAAQLAEAETQLVREREVLARLAAENVRRAARPAAAPAPPPRPPARLTALAFPAPPRIGALRQEGAARRGRARPRREGARRFALRLARADRDVVRDGGAPANSPRNSAQFSAHIRRAIL